MVHFGLVNWIFLLLLEVIDIQGWLRLTLLPSGKHLLPVDLDILPVFALSLRIAFNFAASDGFLDFGHIDFLRLIIRFLESKSGCFFKVILGLRPIGFVLAGGSCIELRAQVERWGFDADRREYLLFLLDILVLVVVLRH